MGSIRILAQSQSGQTDLDIAIPRSRDGARPLDRLTVSRWASADGATITIRLVGEIDLASESQLADSLDLAVRDTAGEIVVDLRAVSFLGVSGLRLLVRAHQRCARLRVVADSRAVVRLLVLAGVDRTLGLRSHP